LRRPDDWSRKPELSAGNVADSTGRHLFLTLPANSVSAVIGQYALWEKINKRVWRLADNPPRHWEVANRMSKSFEVKLNRAAEEIIGKAHVAAQHYGIDFAGDGQNGRFAGHGIEGSYTIDGEVLSLQIKRKPMLIPWSMIETKLLAFFA
jgi:hypothetical protein